MLSTAHGGLAAIERITGITDHPPTTRNRSLTVHASAFTTTGTDAIDTKAGAVPDPPTPQSLAQTTLVPPAEGEDLWADCDGGSSAAAITRGAASSANFHTTEAVLAIARLLDTETFAPDLAHWKKEHHRTMLRLTEGYITHRATLSAAIAAITTVQGAECRTAVDAATQTLFASDRMHDAAFYCLMVLIWHTHPDSTARDLIASIVEDYLLTPHARVQDFKRYAATGRTLNVLTMGHEGDFSAGLARLDHTKNRRFTGAWLDLWSSCVEALCFIPETTKMAELDSVLNAYLIDDITHPLVARPNERVRGVYSRHIANLRIVARIAHRLEADSRIPDTFRCGENFLLAFSDNTSIIQHFERILRDERAPIQGLTLPIVVEVLEEAESRSLSNFSAVAAARQLCQSVDAELPIVAPAAQEDAPLMPTNDAPVQAIVAPAVQTDLPIPEEPARVTSYAAHQHTIVGSHAVASPVVTAPPTDPPAPTGDNVHTPVRKVLEALTAYIMWLMTFTSTSLRGVRAPSYLDPIWATAFISMAWLGVANALPQGGSAPLTPGTMDLSVKPPDPDISTAQLHASLLSIE